MTTIYYNGINPFEGLSATPIVGRQIEMIQYGDRWGQLETITLQGQIIEPCQSLEDLVDKQNELISRFAQDYQLFEIRDNGLVVFSRPKVRITSISFDQSSYGYILPFSITIQAYPEDYFEGEYGILEPREEFSYQEDQNGVLTINHTISARGFNSSSNQSDAFDNARFWVQARQGLTGAVLPKFIEVNLGDTCLITVSEISNRLEASYEIRETYTSDLLLGGYGLLRYTTEYSYGFEDGISTVSVRGDIQGCKNADISQARIRYTQFDAYREAQTQFRKITGRGDLNNVPVSKGVSEDQKTVRIGFDYVFTDDLSPLTHFDYKVSFDYDFETDIVSASIEGTVSSRAPLAQRWSIVNNFANSINLYSILMPLYNSYSASIGANYPLNPIPRQQSRTENQSSFTVELSARYDNAPLPPAGLDSWEYSIDIIPPLHQYAESPCLDGKGKYVTFDLGMATRGKTSIQGSALGNPNSSAETTLDTVKTQIAVLQRLYGNGPRPALEEQSFTQTNASFGLSVSVSASYSYEGPEFTI